MSWFDLDKNNFLMYVLIFCVFLITEPTRNFLEIYQWDLGYTLVTIGWIAGVSSLTAVIGNIFPGMLSDRLGRKKVLVYVVAASLLYPLLLLFMQNLAGLLLAKIIHSIVLSGFFSIAIGYLYDVNKKEVLGKVYSRALMASFIATLVSPYLGGLVIERFGYHWLFSISAYLAVPALFIAYFLKDPKGKRQEKSMKGEFIDIVRRPRFVKIWFVMVVVALSSCLYGTFFPIFLYDVVGLDYSQTGLFLSMVSLVLILVQPLLGKIADHFKSRVVIPAFITLLGLSSIAMAFLSSVITLFIARTLVPISIFGGRVKGAAVVGSVTREEEHALAHGMFKTSSSVGWTIMNFVAPVFIASIGYAATFAAVGIVTLLAGLFYALGYREQRTWAKFNKRFFHPDEHHWFDMFLRK